MGKKRSKISDEEALEALADAVTRAIHWAPESLLVHIATGWREAACRRLALRIVAQLAGDGWGEGRRSRARNGGGDGLHAAIVAGLGGIENGFLLVLPDIQRCSVRGRGRVLDAFGMHFASAIHDAMRAGGVRLRRMDVFAEPAERRA